MKIWVHCHCKSRGLEKYTFMVIVWGGDFLGMHFPRNSSMGCFKLNEAGDVYKRSV